MVKARHHEVLGDLELAFSSDEIARRIKEIALEIVRNYWPPQREEDAIKILIVGVLKGAKPFVKALTNELYLLAPKDAIELRYIRVRTRRQETKSSEPFILQDVSKIKGKHVLLVDDIVDGETTLRFLVLYFAIRGAQTIRTCVLLQRENKANIDPFFPDFVGFNISRPEWLVGFGLDIIKDKKEIGRRMPHIWYVLGTGVG